MAKFNIPIRAKFPDIRKIIADTQPLSGSYAQASYSQRLFNEAMEKRIEMYQRSLISSSTLCSACGIDLDKDIQAAKNIKPIVDLI